VTRYLAIALVLIAATPLQAAEKKLDRSFTVSPGGTLVVDAEGGSVRVTGTDGNAVVVHMVFRGSERDLENATLDAVQQNNDVTVTMRRKSQRSWFWWGGWSGDQDIEVTVPRRYAIDVRTSGGSIELRNTEGTASLRTSGGDISAQNITGKVELKTSGGTIRADGIRGDIDANTSGGDVRLLQVDGKIRAHTSGGSVRCSLVGANRGISATTSGGDVELTLPRSTSGNLEASTSGGDVRSELPVTSTVSDDSRLQGPINGGGAPIYARTSGGSIALRAN
jgi:DUF4097 and DUF4098 domain-containing protein YvlB